MVRGRYEFNTAKASTNDDDIPFLTKGYQMKEQLNKFI